MIAPDPTHHWQSYLMPPASIPGGAQVAIAGHTAGVLGPQMPCWSTVDWPAGLQQLATEEPV